MGIDFESLREDLLTYYGTAMEESPMAMIEVIEVEEASENELLEMARNIGFNLDAYRLWT